MEIKREPGRGCLVTICMNAPNQFLSFRLSDDDISEVYLSERHEIDKENVQYELETLASEFKDVPEALVEGELIPAALLGRMYNNEALLDEMASELRSKLDNDPRILQILWQDCRESIREVYRKHYKDNESKAS